MSGILEELKWITLQKKRKNNRLILICNGLKGKARIATDDLFPKNRLCRNQHSMVFQIPSASKDTLHLGPPVLKRASCFDEVT